VGLDSVVSSNVVYPILVVSTLGSRHITYACRNFRLQRGFAPEAKSPEANFRRRFGGTVSGRPGARARCCVVSLNSYVLFSLNSHHSWWLRVNCCAAATSEYARCPGGGVSPALGDGMLRRPVTMWWTSENLGCARPPSGMPCAPTDRTLVHTPSLAGAFGGRLSSGAPGSDGLVGNALWSSARGGGLIVFTW
jgi:hypothetical protein